MPQDTDTVASAVLVYVTVPDSDCGSKIGRQMVMQRLAACANLIPAIQSFYWWDGQVQEDNEALLLLKTRETLVPQLMDAIAKEHPYDVPAISVISLSKVHGPYLKWLCDETDMTAR